jgi:hypothetical protein
MIFGDYQSYPFRFAHVQATRNIYVLVDYSLIPLAYRYRLQQLTQIIEPTTHPFLVLVASTSC